MEIQSPAFQCIFIDIDKSLSPVVPVSITYHPTHSNLTIQYSGVMEQNVEIQNTTLLKKTVDYWGLLVWARDGLSAP